MIEKIIAVLEARRDSYLRLQQNAAEKMLLEIEEQWRQNARVMDHVLEDVRAVIVAESQQNAKRYLPSRHPARAKL